ncbi:MAG: hypothetical protein B0D92_04925 [Spirochaeta sp. LUC14_002_19_P3]|nr:MAG: hypothetical protein B0D92_04925 [Spirochaeta sp. LUC14_002_19_P3]
MKKLVLVYAAIVFAMFSASCSMDAIQDGIIQEFSYPSIAGEVGKAIQTVSPVTRVNSLQEEASLKFSISEGSLPDGLLLSPTDGSISGIPKTVVERIELTVTVEIVSGNPLYKDRRQALLSITIAQGAYHFAYPAISLTAGTVAEPVFPTGSLIDEIDSAVFSVKTGRLPAGLELDSADGSISGIPTKLYLPDTVIITAQFKNKEDREDFIDTALSIEVKLDNFESLEFSYPPITGTAKQPIAVALPTGSLVDLAGEYLSFSIEDGALPEGLTLNADNGSISGTPAAVFDDEDPIIVTAKINSDLYGTKEAPVPVLVSFPDNIQSLSFSYPDIPGMEDLPIKSVWPEGELIAIAGTQRLSFSILQGHLPDGLTLNSEDGSISGTPTSLYPQNTVVISAAIQLARKSINVQVEASVSIAIDTNNFDSLKFSYPPLRGRANEPMEVHPIGSLMDILGVDNLDFSLAGNNLPVGLELNPDDGSISGTPKVVTDNTLQVTVSAKTNFNNPLYGEAKTATLSVTINLPADIQSIPYSYSNISGFEKKPISLIQPEGALIDMLGTHRLQFSVTEGSLPSGLVLNPEDGTISGTPKKLTPKSEVIVSASLKAEYGSGYGVSQTALTVEVNIENYAVLEFSYPAITGIANEPIDAVHPSGTLMDSPIRKYLVFSLENSELPRGLSLNPLTGGISGTPTRVFDSTLVTLTAKVSLENPLYREPKLASSIIAIAMPADIQSLSFSYRKISGMEDSPITTVSPEGSLIDMLGVERLTFSIQEGPYDITDIDETLPPGMVFNPEDGSISGTPERPWLEQLYSVQAIVNEGNDHASEQFTAPLTVQISDSTDYFGDFSSPYKYNLNIIYFIPADRQVFDDQQRRISEIMLHMQDWYRSEQARNGYANQTFGLMVDNPKNPKYVKFTTIRGSKGRVDYPYSGGASPAKNEINAYLTAHSYQPTSEHYLIFMPQNKEYGGVPFYGIGRWAWVLDYEEFDMSAYWGTDKVQTVGWIGGTIHELGHGLNLPHNRHKVTDGWTSMMSWGNHPYAKNPNGVHLTMASSIHLNNSQVFNVLEGMDYYKDNPLFELKKLTFKTVDDVMQLYAEFTSSIEVNGFIAYNDPKTSEGDADYNSISWGTKDIVKTGPDRYAVQLNMELSGIEEKLRKHPFDLKIRIMIKNGKIQSYNYKYNFVDGKPDLEVNFHLPDIMDTSKWSVIDVSSEETSDGPGRYAFDGNSGTIWHTKWRGSLDPPYPHHLAVSFGETLTINGVVLQPRTNNQRGRLKDVTLLFSDNGTDWWTQGDYTLENNAMKQPIHFNTSLTASHMKIIINAGYDNVHFSHIAEWGVF